MKEISYYEAHKEKVRLYGKLYRETHKEEIKLRKLVYYNTHKEKELLRRRKYRSKPENKEKMALTDRKYREKNKVRKRKANVKREYGVSWERYIEMYEEQWGSCAICGAYKKHPKDESGGILHIDHCHKNKGVRGLLCNSCNLAIGLLKDDVGLLENAINYLKYFQGA